MGNSRIGGTAADDSITKQLGVTNADLAQAKKDINSRIGGTAADDSITKLLGDIKSDVNREDIAIKQLYETLKENTDVTFKQTTEDTLKNIRTSDDSLKS